MVADKTDRMGWVVCSGVGGVVGSGQIEFWVVGGREGWGDWRAGWNGGGGGGGGAWSSPPTPAPAPPPQYHPPTNPTDFNYLNT